MLKAKISKRPFSPDDETAEHIRQWQVPDLTTEFQANNFATNALNKAVPQFQAEADTAEEENLEIKPLTANDMEQIRKLAYDEGFAEGKEEGFGKGYAEGREQGLQDGLTQGLAEGKKQGLTEAQAEIEAKLTQMSQLITQLQQPLATLDKQVEQNLLSLVLAMSKAVIATEVKTNPAIILQVLQEAITALPLQAEHIVIKLHPDDIKILQQHYSEEDLAQRHWHLRAEPTLEQGGCLVESEQSSIDRRLSQRIQDSLEHFLAAEQHEQDSMTSSEKEEES